MRLWAALYGFTWLVFLGLILGLWPDPPAAVPYVHAVVGAGIVVLAFFDDRWLRATPGPARVKRIARATFGLAIAVAVLGVLIWFHVGDHGTIALGYTVGAFLAFLHLANALAILAQASAVAIAYDMWEDREFGRETSPGGLVEVRVPQDPASDPAGSVADSAGAAPPGTKRS